MNQHIDKKITTGVSGKYTITNDKTNEVVLETDNYITDWGMMRMAGHPWDAGIPGANVKAPIGALVENLRYLYLGTNNSDAGDTTLYDLKSPLADFSAWRLAVPWWQNDSVPRPADGLIDGFYDGIKGETLYQRDPATGKLIVIFRKHFKFEITSSFTLKEIGIGPRRRQYSTTTAEWPIEAYGVPVTKIRVSDWSNTAAPVNAQKVAGSISRPFINGGTINIEIDGFPYAYALGEGRSGVATVLQNPGPPPTYRVEPRYKLIAGIFSRSADFTPVDLIAASTYTFTYELKITLNCTEFDKDDIFTPDDSSLPPDTLPPFSQSIRTIRYKPFFELTPTGVPENYYFGVEPFVPPFLETGCPNPGFPADAGRGGKWLVDLFDGYLTTSDYDSMVSTLTSHPTHLAPGDLYDGKFVKTAFIPRDTDGNLVGAFHHYRLTTPVVGIPGTGYDINKVSAYAADKLFNPMVSPDGSDPINKWTTQLHFVGKSNYMFEGGTQINLFKLWKSSGDGVNKAEDAQTVNPVANEKETGFITALSSAYSLTPPAGTSYWFKLNYEINYVRS